MLFVKCMCDHLPVVTNKSKFQNSEIFRIHKRKYFKPMEVPHAKINVMHFSHVILNNIK